MMCNPLFGKQESQESIQESQNQAKIPESRRSKVRVADPSLLDLRKKHTDKLNFNLMKILEKSSPLVTNPWCTKSTILSHYKFQRTYLLLESRSTGKSFSCPCICPFLPHVILCAAKLIFCAHALHSIFVSSRSITLEKELLAQ